MTETNKTQITAGSTSTDTCRLDHIVDGIRYLDADQKLSDLIAEFDDMIKLTNSVTEQSEQTEDDFDSLWFVFSDICDRLNELAPDNLTFGAHPYDGADFGFWEIDES